jgi:DNA repair protein SbcD/Mre11
MAAGGSGLDRAAAERQDGMRLLLFSDLHLDRPYEWAPPTVAEARRAAAREAFVTMLGEARNRSIDVIACAGDLFNRHTVKPANLQWLAAALRSTGVRVLIAPGNDDFVGPLGGYTTFEWPDNVTIFDIDRFVPVEIVHGVTIWGAAHTEAHRLRSFLDGFKVDRPGLNVALFHGAETGGRDREPGLDPCAVFEEAAIERAGFDHALVGHFQRRHFGSMHTYPGAPIAHDFGPDRTGGAVVVTINDNGAIERDYLAVPSPELHEVEVDLTGATSAAGVLRRAGSHVAGLAGVIRMTLTGRVSPDVVLRREDFNGLADSPRDLMMGWRAGVDVDFEQLRDEPTIRGQFVRDVQESSLPDERRDRVLLIGLRALTGHKELEGPR